VHGSKELTGFVCLVFASWKGFLRLDFVKLTGHALRPEIVVKNGAKFGAVARLRE
jgi:hypothetical protein